YVNWHYSGIATVTKGFNYLKTAYVDISDTAPNLVTGDFTIDGADHLLDLSAHLPVGATAVNLKCRGRTTDIAGIAYFRHPDAPNIGSCRLRTQVANHFIANSFVCGLDSGRNIEYKIAGANWDDLTLKISGYWR
ncbi:unnamed protein product, partial [marine sediment metagenome]